MARREWLSSKWGIERRNRIVVDSWRVVTKDIRRVENMALAHQAPALGIGSEPGYRRYLFVLSFGMLFLLFLAAPWPLAHKAHAVLHGLCAQRPSHTLILGGQELPFDARMTGIYGGFLATSAYFVARGRYRAAKTPSILTIVVLGAFVGALAIDGTNSLLLDMFLWHPYEPNNHLRLVTGLITGIALASVVAYLLASTLWRNPNVTIRVITGPSELVIFVCLQAPFALACLSGSGTLFAPLTLLLLVAAVLALTSIMVATVALVRRRDGTFATWTDLQSTAFVALLAALGVMAFFGGGRFVLEHFMGPSPLT
jgi:uncharacterized membrane protein